MLGYTSKWIRSRYDISVPYQTVSTHSVSYLRIAFFRTNYRTMFLTVMNRFLGKL